MRPECAPKVIEKFIRGGRWFVRISPPFNGQEVWRNAPLVWLIGNPAFQDIPKGYEIHHLDGNQLNDDISNLALMQKHHHASYHLKHKVIETKIFFYPNDTSRQEYHPIKEPHFYKPKDRKNFRIFFYDKDEISGKSKRTFLNKWDGKPITTSEMAEEIINLIWKESS